MNFQAVAAVLILVSACASPPSQNEIPNDPPTPSIWLEESTWRFQIIDPDGSLIGSMDILPSQGHIRTCLEGNWKSAGLLQATGEMSEFAFMTEEGRALVAYEIKNASLRIDLHPGICDANMMLHGSLSSTGAAGSIHNSWGHTMGSFTGAPIATVATPEAGFE